MTVFTYVIFAKQKRKPAEMDNDSHVAPKKTSKQEAVVDKEREARFSKLDAWKVCCCL